jgi:large subunit ribosomal protein L6e
MVKKFAWYPAEDDKKHYKKSPKNKTAKLRKSITPGTVLILLAGRFRGRRVVFLRQLPSGLLLVTGPYKVNGVPLRRLNQAYCIATSTKLNVTGVDVSKVTDSLFTRAAETKKSGKKTETEFAGEKKNKTLSAEFIALQKTVDASIIKSIGKDKVVNAYLKTTFSLSNGVLPHELKF